jgi:REP element-mobilizing transposase RayT
MKRVQRDSVGWHVIARGARRLDLFHDEEDFSAFIAILQRAVQVTGGLLWAFALMSNHYHMVVFASSNQLTGCMRRINRLYARYHNRKYGMTGHAFDSPYKAYPQPTPLLLLGTIAYVFMNPVKAGIASRPEDYPWSCVREYLNLEGSPVRVNPTKVMSLVSEDSAMAWKAFHRAMDREARRPIRKTRDTLTRTEIHAQQFGWLLDHAQESRDRLQGEDPVMVAIYWGRQCGITPAAMARVLETLTAPQIRVQLCRFKKELEKDPARAQLLACP